VEGSCGPHSEVGKLAPMKSKLFTSSQQGGIQLNIASRPLQFIAALSALVFVLNFTLEVLVSYGASYVHLVQVLCLIGILSAWVLVEDLLILRLHDWSPFRVLTFLLIMQVAIPILRLAFLAFDSQDVSSDWLPHTLEGDNWHYLFLAPYSLIFMGIHRSIVSLFTLNEKHRSQNIEKQMLSTLNALALARDNETGNHIIRTQNYVKSLALRLRMMGHYVKELNDQCIDTLYKAAPLHDIGKVGIPDNILNKMGPLSDEEWQLMKSHAAIGEAVLSSTDIDVGGDHGVVKKAIQMAGGHHEKWDGTGYPRGLKGNEIPLSARIMGLADVYDALVSERVYKTGWDHEDAVKEIVSKSGIHFDPLVVDALIAEQSNFQEIAQKYRDN
jgi:HD-GYP domain-containing protein (c-di-GMP phosphodiesterase class II)